MKDRKNDDDLGLQQALDLPPEVAARVVTQALAAPPRPSRPPARRWASYATALLLSLAVTCYLARGPLRPAPPRASITNVGGVVIAVTPEGEGRLLRAAETPAATSGTSLIVIHGDRP